LCSPHHQTTAQGSGHVSREQRFDIQLEVARDDPLQFLMRISLVGGSAVDAVASTDEA
jgi:hypothetical protein